jgi:ERCC4-type nuclease
MDEAIRFGQQAVQTALASTQVVDGFFVKHTISIDETIDYLERLTNALKKEYEVKLSYSIYVLSDTPTDFCIYHLTSTLLGPRNLPNPGFCR